MVGLFAFVLVTQSAAAEPTRPASSGQSKAKPALVAPSPDERLATKLAAARKHQGTIRFFKNRPRLLQSGGERARARLTLRRAEERLAVLTTQIAALRRLIERREARRLAGMPPKRAICHVFGRRCGAAISIAWCESRLDTSARNGQYLGLFQMGSSERRIFGHGQTAYEQAVAARRYFVRSGHDWSPWSCRWAAY